MTFVLVHGHSVPVAHAGLSVCRRVSGGLHMTVVCGCSNESLSVGFCSCSAQLPCSTSCFSKFMHTRRHMMYMPMHGRRGRACLVKLVVGPHMAVLEACA